MRVRDQKFRQSIFVVDEQTSFLRLRAQKSKKISYVFVTFPYLIFAWKFCTRFTNIDNKCTVSLELRLVISWLKAETETETETAWLTIFVLFV